MKQKTMGNEILGLTLEGAEAKTLLINAAPTRTSSFDTLLGRCCLYEGSLTGPGADSLRFGNRSRSRAFYEENYI